jgi:hypothetical protein
MILRKDESLALLLVTVLMKIAEAEFVMLVGPAKPS